MIVVAIIGILAVLAIYGVRKYLANAKTAEARNSLGQMGKDQSAEFEKESMPGTTLTPGGMAGISRTLCATPTAPVPASRTRSRARSTNRTRPSARTGTRTTTTPGSGFACLQFSMDAPQYYMYNFVTKGGSAANDTWKATANGDLNGDGTLSTFELDGIIQPSMIFSLAPNLIETNPEE